MAGLNASALVPMLRKAVVHHLLMVAELPPLSVGVVTPMLSSDPLNLVDVREHHVAEFPPGYRLPARLKVLLEKVEAFAVGIDRNMVEHIGNPHKLPHREVVLERSIDDRDDLAGVPMRQHRDLIEDRAFWAAFVPTLLRVSWSMVAHWVVSIPTLAVAR